MNEKLPIKFRQTLLRKRTENVTQKPITKRAQNQRRFILRRTPPQRFEKITRNHVSGNSPEICFPPGVATSSCSSRMLHVLTNTRSTDEHARLSHLCQLARRCARYTTWGFSWEGACTVRSHRHFVALCVRIATLHTGHVRHRGVQQHRQEIVDCACACEFVARLPVSWTVASTMHRLAIYELTDG